MQPKYRISHKVFLLWVSLKKSNVGPYRVCRNPYVVLQLYSYVVWIWHKLLKLCNKTKQCKDWMTHRLSTYDLPPWLTPTPGKNLTTSPHWTSCRRKRSALKTKDSTGCVWQLASEELPLTSRATWNTRKPNTQLSLFPLARAQNQQFVTVTSTAWPFCQHTL